MLYISQSFSQTDLIFGHNKFSYNHLITYLFPNKMINYFNVLDSLMKHRIHCYLQRSFAVAIQPSKSCHLNTKLFKQTTKPYHLSLNHPHASILSLFCIQMRYCCLLLRFTQHNCIPQLNVVTTHKFPCDRTSNPMNVSICLYM